MSEAFRAKLYDDPGVMDAIDNLIRDGVRLTVDSYGCIVPDGGTPLTLQLCLDSMVGTIQQVQAEWVRRRKEPFTDQQARDIALIWAHRIRPDSPKIESPDWLKDLLSGIRTRMKNRRRFRRRLR